MLVHVLKVDCQSMSGQSSGILACKHVSAFLLKAIDQLRNKGAACAASPLSATFSIMISFWSCVGNRPLDDSKRLCAHLLEKAIDQLDEECETILGIFDLRAFGPQNADFGFVRFLVGTLLHAPCQQHASLCMCPLLIFNY